MDAKFVRSDYGTEVSICVAKIENVRLGVRKV